MRRGRGARVGATPRLEPVWWTLPPLRVLGRPRPPAQVIDSGSVAAPMPGRTIAAALTRFWSRTVRLSLARADTHVEPPQAHPEAARRVHGQFVRVVSRTVTLNARQEGMR